MFAWTNNEYEGYLKSLLSNYFDCHETVLYKYAVCAFKFDFFEDKTTPAPPLEHSTRIHINYHFLISHKSRDEPLNGREEEEESAAFAEGLISD